MGPGKPVQQSRVQFLPGDCQSPGSKAAPAAEVDAVQGNCPKVVLSPQKLEKGNGGRGQAGGTVGLKAQVPHPEVGPPGQLRQAEGKGLVIFIPPMIGHHQSLSVGTIDPALGKVNPFFLRKVGCPGGHDPQAEALDLLGKQAVKVVGSVQSLVAAEEGRPGQQIHRVGDLAEDAGKARLPGLGRGQ